MLGSRPAHPIMASIGFGCSVAAAIWLLPVARRFTPDPLLLPAVAASSSIAGGLLLYAVGWRVVAAGTSALLLACFAVIHLRVRRGSWSGPPLALSPILLLVTASWIPRRHHGNPLRSVGGHESTRIRVDGTRRNSRDGVLGTPAWIPPQHPADGDRPIRLSQVTCRLNGRWAVLGGQRLPGADPSGHSRVHLALDTWHHGCHVVAKLPGGPDPSQSRARLVREAGLLQAARANPHVVRLLEAGQDRSTGAHYLILAHYPQGSLAGLLAVTASFELGWALHVAQELLRGLVSLQQHPDGPIAHRDLNPRNVLLGLDRMTPVICDLGMARRITAGPTDDAVTTVQVYSPWYSAPELVHGRTPWGLDVDSYGIGAILYELLTGHPPLRREGLRLRHDFVTLASAGVRPTSAGAFNRDLPVALVDLVDRCLAVDPTDRPPAAEDLLRTLERLRGFDDLPIPYAALRRGNGPTRLRSA
jgi:hypothetical protein